MSLDVSLMKTKQTEFFWANITHNIADMSAAAGIYMHLWRPDEIGITRASQLIEPLEEGLAKMRAAPDKYREYDSPNGWGTYDDFVTWIERYVEACKQSPDAEVIVSR